MKKSLLIFPLVVVLGLTGCKKVNKQSAKSADFEDLEYTENLTSAELKAFWYDMLTGLKGVNGIEYDKYTLAEKENSSDERTQHSEVVYYSNANHSVTETSEVKVSSGGLSTMKTDIEEEDWTYLKGLNALYVRESSLSGFSTGIRTTFATEEDGADWMKLQSYNSAAYLLDKVVTDLQSSDTSKFAKDGDGVLYLRDSISENYQYAPNRSELDVHSVTREQWVAKFNAKAELVSYKHIKEELSNKDNDTGKIVDDLDYKSVTKEVLELSYGALEAGQVPEKFGDLAVIFAVNPLKLTAKVAAPAEAHATTDFGNMTIYPEIVKRTSKTGGKLALSAHVDTGYCLMLKGDLFTNTRVYNAETKKFDDAKLSDAIAVDLGEAFAAKGFEAKACSDDASAKFIEFKEDINLYFSADFELAADGKVTISNISLAFLTE